MEENEMKDNDIKDNEMEDNEMEDNEMKDNDMKDNEMQDNEMQKTNSQAKQLRWIVSYLVVPLVTTLSPVMEISQRMVRVSLGSRLSWGCRSSEWETNLGRSRESRSRSRNGRSRSSRSSRNFSLSKPPVITRQILLEGVLAPLGPGLLAVLVYYTEDYVRVYWHLGQQGKVGGGSRKKQLEVK